MIDLQTFYLSSDVQEACASTADAICWNRGYSLEQQIAIKNDLKTLAAAIIMQISDRMMGIRT